MIIIEFPLYIVGYDECMGEQQQQAAADEETIKKKIDINNGMDLWLETPAPQI